ncbi:MAG: metallophosphoesterase [Pseudomonadota bacterium]
MRGAAEKPDIVLWLGDYAYKMGYIERYSLPDPSFMDTEETIAAMASIDAPMGSYAILGNHDWWWNGLEVLTLLTQTHIQPLVDDAILATHPETGAALWIAGLDDVSAPRPSDPEAVLGRTDQSAPVVMLSHSPDIWPRIPASVPITFAGHTHCGQIALPFIQRAAAPIRSKDLVCGLTADGPRQLYVSSGVGVGGVPARFLAPPEIVIVSFVPAQP